MISVTAWTFKPCLIVWTINFRLQDWPLWTKEYSFSTSVFYNKRHAIRYQASQLALDGNQYNTAHEKNEYQD